MSVMKDKRNINIRNVANLAGVSAMAVSRVLNKKPGVSASMRKNVLSACYELNYCLNPSIQDMILKGINGHSRNLALVMVGQNFIDPAYVRILEGVANGVNEHSYNLALAHLSGNEKTVYELPPILRDKRIDGILISGSLNHSIMQVIKKLKLPHLIIGTYTENVTGTAPCVRLNLSIGLQKVVAALKSAGKEKIAYFTENSRSFFEKVQLATFKNNLAANGLEVSDDRIFFGGGEFTGAFKTMLPVFLQPYLPFDAIVCMDFRSALEISHLILARTGLGKKIDLIVATTSVIPNYTLPVPAVYLDGCMDKMAYQGTLLMIRLLEGKTVESRITELPQEFQPN